MLSARSGVAATNNTRKLRQLNAELCSFERHAAEYARNFRMIDVCFKSDRSIGIVPRSTSTRKLPRALWPVYPENKHNPVQARYHGVSIEK